jgi:hypothetical protein
MKADELVKKRFKELAEKAEALTKNETSKIRGWGTSALTLLQHTFGESNPHYMHFKQKYDDYDFHELEYQFEEAKAIFLAAKEDYEGGYLFNIRALVAAEVFDDALEQATEFLNKGFKDPACVVAGVVLETTLKELCTRNHIPHAKMEAMNIALCKAGTYDLPKQQQITAWAALRNKAAHGGWSAYNEADVKDLIEGMKRFMADYL